MILDFECKRVGEVGLWRLAGRQPRCGPKSLASGASPMWRPFRRSRLKKLGHLSYLCDIRTGPVVI
jgi:hypothetical protein